jgi:hypothetical protein
MDRAAHPEHTVFSTFLSIHSVVVQVIALLPLNLKLSEMIIRDKLFEIFSILETKYPTIFSIIQILKTKRSIIF